MTKNGILFIGLFFSFIATIVFGTLSHEFGHYLIARIMGYEARVNYWSTVIEDIGEAPEIQIAITLGGPLETVLTGTMGLVLLFKNRVGFHNAENLSAGQWLIVFLSLFWMRQTVNICVWLGDYFLTGKFSSQMDEICIANYLALPSWSILVATAIIGAAVLTIVTFKFIPAQQRITFLAAGLLGGLAGCYVWFVALGKYLLP